MNNYLKPIICVSKCLGFDKCRWNGVTIHSSLIEHLKKHVKFIPICPEIEIGLGAPRKQIGIVLINKQQRLIQHKTELDITDKMISFINGFLDRLTKVDGFILKKGSPSCGLKGVRVYPRTGKVAPVYKAPGFFGREVLKRFPLTAIEDEKRLTNFNLREHFLTKLFFIAEFRRVKAKQKLGLLVKFHTKNKMLLLAYNQSKYRSLGKVVANQNKLPISQVLAEYEKLALDALVNLPRTTSVINVLMHAMGYFSKNLTTKEKAFFLDLLEKYRNHQICISTVNAVIQSWIIRYNNEYLEQQSFFNSFPEDLVEVTDSGKGRKL